ncbi:MAG: alpha/beta hydrolase, partial [Schleiferiaceae bacterium]|nr:alpha/beta hydrolase [Schleiferiaceae bacterium]
TYDYRGFGHSEGPSTGTESMRQDLHAAMQFLKDNGLSNDRLMVIGSSLGSLPSGQEAGDATGPLTINKLLLEAPQSSANFLMQNASGLSLTSSMLTDFNFDLAASMSLYSGELMWFHGTEDQVAPPSSALEVYKAHKGTYKEAYLIPEVGHGFRWGWGKDLWGEAVWSFMKH